MTGFMFILLVAMLLGIILMYIIDCHMAKTVDDLDDLTEIIGSLIKDVKNERQNNK